MYIISCHINMLDYVRLYILATIIVSFSGKKHVSFHQHLFAVPWNQPAGSKLARCSGTGLSNRRQQAMAI